MATGTRLPLRNNNAVGIPVIKYTVNTEWGRLFSYSTFRLNFNVSSIELARHGFYLINDDQLKCYACGVTIKEWPTPYEHPLTIHRNKSPHCLHINGKVPNARTIAGSTSVIKQILLEPNSGDEIPLYSQRGLVTNNGSSPCDQGSALSIEEISDAFDTQNENLNSPLTINSMKRRKDASQRSADSGYASLLSGQHSNYHTKLSVSANSDQSHSGQSSKSAAAAANSYEGEKNSADNQYPNVHTSTQLEINTVSATAMTDNSEPILYTQDNLITKASFGSTQEDRNISTATQHSSPNVNAAIPGINTKGKENLVSTPTKSPSQRSIDSAPSTAGARIDSSVTTARETDVITPKYPMYAILCTRLKTFDQWPLKQYIDPMFIADAGFFYVGHADYTRCFFCAGGLKNWEAGDDPWVEHARWFSKCPFLKMNKGEEFIKQVQEAVEEAERTESASQIIAENNRNSQKPEFLLQETPSSSNKTAEDKDNNDAIWSLPSVLSVLEIGCSKEEVIGAIKSLDKDATEIRAAELMDTILNMNEKET